MLRTPGPGMSAPGWLPPAQGAQVAQPRQGSLRRRYHGCQPWKPDSLAGSAAGALAGAATSRPVESRASEKSTEPNHTLGIDQPTRTPRTHPGGNPISTKGDPTISAELPQRQLSPHGRPGRTTLTSQQRSSNWRRPILTRPPISRQTATTASASTGRSPRGPVRCAGRSWGDGPVVSRR